MNAARQFHSGGTPQREQLSIGEWIVRAAVEFMRLGISLGEFRRLTLDQIRVIQEERERVAASVSRRVQDHIANCDSRQIRPLVRYTIPLES